MTTLGKTASAAACFVLVQAGMGHAESMATEQMQQMHRFTDESVIEATQAKLSRMESGVYTVATTSELDPGHAVTLWWVVFNDPAACSDGACGEDDIFNLDANGEFILTEDGSPPMNHEMIEKADISVLRADGRVVGPDGTATYKAYLPMGDDSDAVFGAGLKDPMHAEVHLVLRDHMAPTGTDLAAALNEIHGACDQAWPNEPCTDLQFAVFPPPMPMN